MKRFIKSAGKFLGKTAAFKMGNSIMKNGGITTIEMGMAFVTGYYIHTTLKK